MNEEEKRTFESQRGIEASMKVLVFVFGIFLVAFSGRQYLFKVSGTEKQELILYYSGLLFWISLIALIVFVS